MSRAERACVLVALTLAGGLFVACGDEASGTGGGAADDGGSGHGGDAAGANESTGGGSNEGGGQNEGGGGGGPNVTPGGPVLFFSDLVTGPRSGNSDTSQGQTAGTDSAIVSWPASSGVTFASCS